MSLMALTSGLERSKIRHVGGRGQSHRACEGRGWTIEVDADDGGGGRRGDKMDDVTQDGAHDTR
jgi:hypothetical protein